jgi:hypothetical protein
MSDESTIPPHQPNTARNILLRAYTGISAWSAVHTIAATGIGAFIAGFIVGKIL